MSEIDILFSFDFYLWLWKSGEIWEFLHEVMLVLVSAFCQGGLISYHSNISGYDI